MNSRYRACRVLEGPAQGNQMGLYSGGSRVVHWVCSVLNMVVAGVEWHMLVFSSSIELWPATYLYELGPATYLYQVTIRAMVKTQ